MKKAAPVLLFITTAFICIMVGTMIGRHTSGNLYNISNMPAVEITNETIAQTQPGKLNINTASLTQIDDLPGLGPVLAQRIIDYREENGPFSSLEDLLLVEGIGEFRLNEIKDYITTGG